MATTDSTKNKQEAGHACDMRERCKLLQRSPATGASCECFFVAEKVVAILFASNAIQLYY